jgi:Bax protein
MHPFKGAVAGACLLCSGLSGAPEAQAQRDAAATPRPASPAVAALQAADADRRPGTGTAGARGRADRADLADLDLAKVRAGAVLVPRVRVTGLPERLTDLDDVARRKALFVRTLLPPVLKANRKIARQRDLIQALRRLDPDWAALTPALRGKLRRLAERYGTEPGDFETLLRRVDRIPPGLVLAQAAIETGWGTSRFAQQGNALFGEHTRDPDAAGLTPRGRPDAGFKVRAFGSLGAAVAAYMHNLNTHPAYRELRAIRARARAAGRRPSGLAMAAGLEDYAATGRAYIEDVRITIEANDFDRFRRARLEPRLRPSAGLAPQIARRPADPATARP